MVDNIDQPIGIRHRIAAWLVHLFTASGAVFGLLTFYSIHQIQFLFAFWLMGAAMVIDAVDGTLARRARTKIVAPKVDGALLDNIIDYANYVLAPAFFLLVSDLLPEGGYIGDFLPGGWRLLGTSLIVLASAYQFTQPEAKTDDHFFKGFPSYWNFVVFYLFFWQTSQWTNLIVILVLVVLIFVPIKYIYPSRMEHLTHINWLRQAMMIATILWGIATALLLWIYPSTNTLLVIYSIAYVILYAAVSIYRTLVPLEDVAPKNK